MIVAKHQRNVAEIVISDLRGDVVPQLKATSTSRRVSVPARGLSLQQCSSYSKNLACYQLVLNIFFWKNLTIRAGSPGGCVHSPSLEKMRSICFRRVPRKMG